MKRIIPAFLLFVFNYAYSQNWVSMMHNPAVNVHDVQKAFYKWYAEKKKDSKAGNNFEDEECALFKRWEAYMVPRTYPSGVRPEASLLINEYNRHITDKAEKRATGAANWTYSGNDSVPSSTTYPEGGDGRVNRIRFYPGNNNIIYACSPTGGLWKSIDGGTTWNTNTDNLADLATSDLAIDPIKNNIMYLMTGDGDGVNSYTIGVLRSIDGGNTWKPTGLTYAFWYAGTYYLEGTQLQINPDSTNLVYAATNLGLMMSQDSGVSWSTNINDDVRSIEFMPGKHSVMYAASYTGKFYRSTNYGRTFNRIKTGLPDTGVARMSIGVSPADPARVYVLCEDSTSWGFAGLYMSEDSGKTFTTQSTAPNIIGYSSTGSTPGGYGWYTLSIAVSPTNADSVFCGGVQIWGSSNKGVNWSLVTQWYGSGAPYVHADCHHITYMPGTGTVFVGCDGGIFKSTNGGVSWKDMSHNLKIGELYSIGLSALTSGLNISGWQDNGTNLSKTPWAQVYGGDGEDCFIDYTNDMTLFASTENGNLVMSSDGGNTFNAANNGITENGPWNTKWLQDPQNFGNLFAGFMNVWESFDQGTTWGPLSSWGTSTISALQVAPSSDQYIYAAQADSIFTTNNNGGTWTCINKGLPLSLASISAIAISPNDPRRVWVAFSGYSSANKVYESKDSGATWKNISSGLPNLPVNCMIYHPGTGDGIYVGTDMGVYYHDSTMSSWVSYNSGLPNVMVDDIKIYQPGNTLYAATYGRGVWQTPTYVLVGVNELSNNPNNIIAYPNPTTGVVNVTLNLPAGDYTISVANVLGQTVVENKISCTGEYKGTVDLSCFGKGVYMLSIKGNVNKMSRKILVY